jgi:hypothetical protein
MLSGILTATVLWVVNATGTLPDIVTPLPARAVENIYYVQIDGMT